MQQRLMKLEANRSESHRRLETLFQTTLHRAFTGDLTASWRETHNISSMGMSDSA